MTQDRVTIQEAARIANISRKTLYRWIEKGLLSREKDKNLSYVSLAEVKALCDRVTNQQDTNNVTGNNQGTKQDINRVTVDVTYLEGLMVRLGQYEAERRYLLEYKASIEGKDKALLEQAALLEQKNKEIDELKVRLIPWWKRIFKR